MRLSWRQAIANVYLERADALFHGADAGADPSFTPDVSFVASMLFLGHRIRVEAIRHGVHLVAQRADIDPDVRDIRATVFAADSCRAMRASRASPPMQVLRPILCPRLVVKSSANSPSYLRRVAARSLSARIVGISLLTGVNCELSREWRALEQRVTPWGLFLQLVSANREFCAGHVSMNVALLLRIH